MKNKNILYAAASLLALPTACSDKHEQCTNIILINLDDSGYGDFSYNGAYGYLTPNIDRLASEGVRFTHFYSAQAISGASRAGLMTGCYPNRWGFWGAPFPGADMGLPEEETTIPEVMKSAGYKTAMFGKWHLGDAHKYLPLQHGFDEYFGVPYSNDMRPETKGFVFPDLPLYDGNEVAQLNPDNDMLTTMYTEHAVDFIRRNRKQPFFIYMAHNMPHVPLGVSDKFRGKSELGLYGDVMMEIDWSVGQIMSTLRELGLEDNTLVILTSDNGPWINYGNHAGNAGGLREGKSTNYEGGPHVACLMYWKGHTDPGTTCNGLASAIDLLPTFAEIAGAELPAQKIDGVSILPLIEDHTAESPRKSFAYYFQRNALQAVTDGQYKLIFPHQYQSYYLFEPGRDGVGGKLGQRQVLTPELYDLRRDPGEHVNVIEYYPEIVERLNALADEIRADLGDHLTGVEGSGRRGRLDMTTGY